MGAFFAFPDGQTTGARGASFALATLVRVAVAVVVEVVPTDFGVARRDIALARTPFALRGAGLGPFFADAFACFVARTGITGSGLGGLTDRGVVVGWGRWLSGGEIVRGDRAISLRCIGIRHSVRGGPWFGGAVGVGGAVFLGGGVRKELSIVAAKAFVLATKIPCIAVGVEDAFDTLCQQALASIRAVIILVTTARWGTGLQESPRAEKYYDEQEDGFEAHRGLLW